jgi:ATP-dependent Lon protease
MLAAHRAGIKYILLPAENRRDLSDIPANVRRKVEVKLVEHMDEVLDLALVEPVCGNKKKVNNEKVKEEAATPIKDDESDSAFQH